ncbi:MAG TPA: efflux RND transporter periplasmic adaptor subunit [Gemmatimonadales bacterium]|nr:efflux RND transporter periplasmic adaptor subunit [Gemmatimonadales bacterium]
MPRIQAVPTVLALVALWAGAAACSGGSQESRAAAARPADAGPLLPVAAVPVQRRDLARSVTVTGPVEPVRTIGVNSQTSGSVLAVHVQEGDRVAEGALLAELDGREAEAQLARARAVLESARDAFGRDSQLHASAIITDADFERTRSAYMVARSEAELWETRRAFTRITAPSAGVVTAKHIEAGSAVSPNQRLFDLADMSLLVVRVQLSELDVVHLARGVAVAVLLDAYPDARLEGRVRRIFPSADPQSRLVPVEVALEARPPGVEVRPGFLARVGFALDRRPRALAVPPSAVGIASTGAFVYTVDSDTLAQKPVTLGVTAEGWVEVKGGLQEGEQVVVSGHANLRPGARVRVRPGLGAPTQ